MKRIIAFFLIAIFMGSASVKLYNDFTEKTSVCNYINENEDDAEEKEIEKENDLKKDKLSVSLITISPLQINLSQNFYIKNYCFLQAPFIAKDIIPPNKA